MSFEFTSFPVYVHLMSGNRFTFKKSCLGTGTFAFPHVLINPYFSKYRTEFSVYLYMFRKLEASSFRLVDAICQEHRCIYAKMAQTDIVLNVPLLIRLP